MYLHYKTALTIFNVVFYSHFIIDQRTLRELVLARQVNMLELPFPTTDVCVDECLYMNKSLHSIYSSCKAIIQKIRIKPLSSYGLVLQSLDELL